MPFKWVPVDELGWVNGDDKGFGVNDDERDDVYEEDIWYDLSLLSFNKKKRGGKCLALQTESR